MEQEFKIPYMVLHRGDLEEFDTKEKPISQTLTDEQMQRIASLISKGLMQDWNLCLRLAIEEVV